MVALMDCLKPVIGERPVLADNGRSGGCQPASSNVRQPNNDGWYRTPGFPKILTIVAK